VVPHPIIDFSLGGLNFDCSRAHVQKQVQPSIQQLHRKEVHLVVLLPLHITSVLSAEVKGDGADAFGVPLRQGEKGVRGLEIDGV
uniref:Uncharacterized protein n=1 Tax=Cyprinodon variegatus TaxID=28743 RepID=A0A3Q2CGP9_CYPVA